MPVAAYDRRQKGASGLSLAAPFPELKLKAGERVELCSDFPDIGALLRTSSFLPEGVPLLFWEAENETLCLCRCPLFNRHIVLNPNTAVARGLLHTNHLGVMLLYCRHVAWEFFAVVFGEWLRVRVVRLVRVQAAAPPHRKLNLRC